MFEKSETEQPNIHVVAPRMNKYESISSRTSTTQTNSADFTSIDGMKRSIRPIVRV
ncbi:hypothetical protein D3C75_1209500 [compost metagenome]